jgi:hypothetical protein
MKVLHWNRILLPSKSSPGRKDTVWDEIRETPLDSTEFEELFGVAQKAAAPVDLKESSEDAAKPKVMMIEIIHKYSDIFSRNNRLHLSLIPNDRMPFL